MELWRSQRTAHVQIGLTTLHMSRCITTQPQDYQVIGDKYFKHTYLAATFRVEWLSKAVTDHLMTDTPAQAGLGL